MKVSLSRTIETTANRAWDALEGFDLAYLGPNGPACQVSGAGLGATRKVALPDGELAEQIERFEPAVNALGYTILYGPLPVASYHALVQVFPQAENTCEVTWSAEFEPHGASEEAARAAVEGLLKFNLSSLRKHLLA